MRKKLLLAVTHLIAVAVGVGLGLSIQDGEWLRVLFFVLLLLLLALNVQSIIMDHVEREQLRADLARVIPVPSTETKPAPRRDADIIRETYGDGHVTLHGPGGSTITGTAEQIDGLGSEMERRRQGARPQFTEGEQVDW